jgi:ferric-dicitrate binding protein FerR (iron transport regulator)
MFRKHVVRHLSEYNDDELSAAGRLRVEAHLRTCSKCRAALEEIRFGSRLASSLSLSAAPDLDWSELPAPIRRRFLPAAVLATVVFGTVLLVFWSRTHIPAMTSWEVTGLPGKSQLQPGEVLQTDSSTEAQVKIANIGQLLIDPNTRIRLLVTQPDQHRIALERGKLEATTWAPPRLFFMETPSATAVDLGCRYTMEVQDDGSSLLHVILGLVALDRNGGETIVPAGAFCRTHRGNGPGTPYFEDSSALFQSALEKVDSLREGPERNAQLESVIRESHARDGLSLWYLLPRLDSQARGRVYDRLAQWFPPPPEVTRDGIVALDAKMLGAWKRVVSQLWQ